MTSQWTVEKIADVKRLLAEGKSAAHIADIIGTTKNAVVGKVHRLGDLVGELNGLFARQPGRRPKPGQRLIVYRTYAAVEPTRPRYAPTAKAKKVFKPKSKKLAPSRCTLMQLDTGTCRWPMWGEKANGKKFYCGAEVEGTVYCEEHDHIAYRPLRRSTVPSPDLTAVSTAANSP